MEPESWVAREGPEGFGESELPDFEDRFRLSDLGNLARLARRRVVRTARFQDRPSFAGILLAHLQTDLEELEVVEESWPSYDLVNVQVGLDAWLAKAGSITRSSVCEDTGISISGSRTCCTPRNQASTGPCRATSHGSGYRSVPTVRSPRRCWPGCTWSRSRGSPGRMGWCVQR